MLACKTEFCASFLHLFIVSEPRLETFNVSKHETEIPHLSETKCPGNKIKQLLTSGFTLRRGGGVRENKRK